MSRNLPGSIAAALLDSDAREFARDASRLPGLGQPGVYAWFTDAEGARDLSVGLASHIKPGLIYAGQTGSGTSGATLGTRLRGNHLGGNTYGSTFRLTLASILRARLGLHPMGGRRMDGADEPKLTAWMLGHLSVAAHPLSDRTTVEPREASSDSGPTGSDQGSERVQPIGNRSSWTAYGATDGATEAARIGRCSADDEPRLHPRGTR
jgi:hypothetical protein